MKYLYELDALPKKVEEVLQTSHDTVKKIAKRLCGIY